MSVLHSALHDLQLLLLAAVRLLVLFAFVPLFGGAALAALVRLMLALALASLVVPGLRLQWAALPGDPTTAGWLLLLCKEAALGLLLGFAGGAVPTAAEALGKILDQQTGSTQSAVNDPLTRQPQGPTGTFLLQLVCCALLLSGAFLVLLGAVYDSYALWPVLSWWPAPFPSESLLLGEFARQTDLALQLALPFLALLLLLEFASGLAARAVPGLDSSALAMGLKVLGVQCLLLVLISTLLAHLVLWVAGAPLGLLSGLGAP